MSVEILTKDDLNEFSDKLIQEIKSIIKPPVQEPEKWLKSYQVKNMLKISSNTLQTLRDSKVLPFSKVGRIFYYRYEDILSLLKTSSSASKS